MLLQAVYQNIYVNRDTDVFSVASVSYERRNEEKFLYLGWLTHFISVVLTIVHCFPLSLFLGYRNTNSSIKTKSNITQGGSCHGEGK